MFGGKKLLEIKVERLENENRELKNAIDTVNRSYDRLKMFEDNTPEGCKVGAWCRGCQYGKVVYAITCDPRWDGIRTKNHPVYICGKAEICKNFTQK